MASHRRIFGCMPRTNIERSADIVWFERSKIAIRANSYSLYGLGVNALAGWWCKSDKPPKGSTPAIRLLTEIHVGLGVDTERGLLVVVIRDADKKSILQISQELGDKIKRAIAGKGMPDELTGGTFTIINLPEIAVLGIGRIEEKPAAHKGALCLRNRMSLNLTFDHRWVDGAPAARFLQKIGELIEKPYQVLIAMTQ